MTDETKNGKILNINKVNKLRNGTKLEIAHNAATPVGMQVWCESELVEVDGRRLVFKVEAFDAKGSIGGGTHERFIIKNEKFLAKAQSKKEN